MGTTAPDNKAASLDTASPRPSLESDDEPELELTFLGESRPVSAISQKTASQPKSTRDLYSDVGRVNNQGQGVPQKRIDIPQVC